MPEVGRYRVVRSLGRGGMAEVFEAVAVGEGGFERRVAVKKMLPELQGDAAFGAMFLDEARTASALHHANLVAVLDYGVADGAPFQVLEFVDGMDAERLCAAGREAGAAMPVEVALHVCLQVAHALDYVHTARDAHGEPLGVVHRDVSPSNVLLAYSGDVKLADFGIALARTRTSETLAGVTRGKPAFMAPEQVVRGALDGRTDVFALGLTLHAMLTGQSPLSRDNAVADLLAGGDLALDPGLPDDVRDLIARATRGARAKRLASAAEMAALLSDALAARAGRDGRAELSRWLERVREPSGAGRVGAPRRGALDALLAVDLVLDRVAEGSREFVTVPARPDAPEPAQPDAPARQEAPPASPTPQGSTSTARRPARGAVAAAAALATAGLLWFATRRPEPSASPAAAPPARDASRALSTPTPAREAPAAPPIAEPAPPAPAPAPVSVSVSVSRAPSRAAHPEREHTTVPAPAPPSAPAPATNDSATGVVVVGGEGALGAEILVDGARRGHAPRSLVLPVGHHAIQLVRADGLRVGPASVDVTERHTPSAPLRVRFP